MDDFRVGSVPPSEPYGDRHPYGTVARKRHKHDGQEDHEPEEPEDSFEATAGDQESPAADNSGEVADYYIPSEPRADED